MRRPTFIALMFLVGCKPPTPPAQLGPTQLTSALAPVEVVRRAAAVLVTLGFEIAISDATGGVVQAKRARAGTMSGISNDPPPDLTCLKYGAAATLHLMTYTVYVNAIARDQGSAVTITSRINSTWPGIDQMIRPAPNDTDCASNGSVERQVIAAIGAQ
jgi:hypothetical protein